jgi:hypothetical protein
MLDGVVGVAELGLFKRLAVLPVDVLGGAAIASGDLSAKRPRPVTRGTSQYLWAGLSRPDLPVRACPCSPVPAWAVEESVEAPGTVDRADDGMT